MDINKNATLTDAKLHLKTVLEIMKYRSTTLNIKMIRNYQKNFRESKGAIEHQKLHENYQNMPFIQSKQKALPFMFE